MAIIQRKLPKTNNMRERVLAAAKQKRDHAGSIGLFLTAATTTRLDNIVAQYNTAMTQIRVQRAQQSRQTSVKNDFGRKCKMLVSHFIQVFNLCVERGVFQSATRAYYQLDANSGAVPKMKTDAMVKNWAQNLVSGETGRVAAGGTAMTNPAIGEVDAAHTLFHDAWGTHSNLKDALDMAQEEVAKLNNEADRVIKKVWGEVETFFNEEEPGSMRDNAREWGIVYLRIGKLSNLHVVVKNKNTGEPLSNALCVLEETGNKKKTNAQGKATIKTQMTGEGTITATADGLNPVSVKVDIKEGKEVEVTVEM